MYREMGMVLAFHEHVKVSPGAEFGSHAAPDIDSLALMVANAADIMEEDINKSPRHLRCHLCAEETGEFMKACAEGDEAKALDALTDLLYVVLGTAVTFGWPLPLAFEEVHASNMTKEKQPDDPSAGRVRQKGPNYRAPNLAQFIKSRK